MSTIKNVALIGGAGSLGSKVLDKLVASGKFNITVLRRHGSSSTYPSSITVKDVDFLSVDSLKTALEGQDAVISTIGTFAIESQIALVDAAVAAGVKRILPSEFGSNLDNPKTRKLPVFTHKVQIQDNIIEKSKTTDLTYTFVYNSAFLDWGLEHNFILKTVDYKPTILDGGNTSFSTTTLATVADAVVGILTHPEETKNRAVYIHDTITTQNRLLELAKEVAPEKPWAPEDVKIDDLTNASDAQLASGNITEHTFFPYLFRAVLDPAYGGKFETNDNELLGLKTVGEAEIKEILKRVIK